VEKFLFPQKADPNIPNVLAVSLGPILEGEPASGAVPRYPGDLLLVCTDGVWDFAGPNFPLAVAQTVVSQGGDLRSVVDSVVGKLANAKDPVGYICSDNLTLGLILDPIQAGPQAGKTAMAASDSSHNSFSQEASYDARK